MKCLKYLFFALIIFASTSFAQQKKTPLSVPEKVFKMPKGVTVQDYLPNTLIVKFKNQSASGKQLRTSSGNKINISQIKTQQMRAVFDVQRTNRLQSKDKLLYEKSGLADTYEIKYNENRPIEEVINKLLKNPDIEYAEPSYIYHTGEVPNDPAIGQNLQSYLNRIKAPQAWEIQPNAVNVIIAIVDSGADLDHEDLQDNIYINTADPVNSLDDDNDGYVDNYSGWDFVGATANNIIEDNDANVSRAANDHGVHVSGLAAAVTNNAKGVASVAQTAKLMIVKTGADDDDDGIYRGYDGIVYAVEHGATIINCSWGGAGGGQFGQSIIDYATARGCLVVAAAGNDGGEIPNYPAAYNGVFSVANINNADKLNGTSNYGYDVDISAPGTAIYSTTFNNSYGLKSGTSMATPIVSSAAALVKARFPDLSGEQIGELLRVSSDPSVYQQNTQLTGKMGKGRLDVEKALSNTSPSIRYQNLVLLDNGNGSFPVGDTAKLYFNVKNYLKPATGLNISVTAANSFIEVLTPEQSLGTLETLDAKPAGEFSFIVKNGAPENADIVLKVNYTSNAGTYRETEYIKVRVNLDYQNVIVNQLKTTITSNGRFGYSSAGAVNGLGVLYKDKSLLYEGALLIGRSSDEVSNNARSTDNSSSEDFVKKIQVKQVAGSDAAYEGQSVFTDSGSSSALNIDVKYKQTAYSDASNDKFVILEYEIVNNNNYELGNIYCGLFADFDVANSSKNATKYLASEKTALAYSKEANQPFVGIKLLNNISPAAYYPLSYQVNGDLLEDNNFTTAEKFTTLSSGIKATQMGVNITNGYDVMFVIGSGPYYIPANKSVKLAFALVVGDNETSLIDASRFAEAKYATVLTAIAPELGEENLELFQNYPNPAKNRTTFKFSLTEPGTANIKMYNINGQLLKTLVNDTFTAGTFQTQVDLTGLYPGVYMCKLTTKKKESTLKMIVN